MEIWKDIEGYEGYYQVSNMGNVKSLNYNRTGKEGILKLGKDSKGYLFVVLCKENTKKPCRIHRLVATAFCENPHGYKEVNHISEDKTDNRAENLEWVSHEYNSNYGTRNKRIAEKLSKPIYGINKVNGLIVEFKSSHEAGRTLGIAQQNINACCKGKYKSAGGFYWFFAESEEVDHE